MLLSADSLTIISVKIYCYWTRTVGVIAKGSRGPIFFETQCSIPRGWWQCGRWKRSWRLGVESVRCLRWRPSLLHRWWPLSTDWAPCEPGTTAKHDTARELLVSNTGLPASWYSDTSIRLQPSFLTTGWQLWLHQLLCLCQHVTTTGFPLSQ